MFKVTYKVMTKMAGTVRILGAAGALTDDFTN